MTWILQATHADWTPIVPSDSGSPETLGLYSPVITVPYDTDVLFMDVTLYDESLSNPARPVVVVQYWLREVNLANPGKMGTHNYVFESDFYYNHHNSAPDPFTTVTAVELRKDGGAWTMGDTFVVLWLFYEVDYSMVAGLKSIRIY